MRYQTGRELADDLLALTRPGSTPTLRQGELPTAPVRSLAGTATSPAYTPATIISPEAQALSAAAPTVLGAAPTVVSSPPPLPRSDAPPQPVPVRRGGGAMLVAGLGLAALLVLAVIGAVAWKFMSGRGASTATTAGSKPGARRRGVNRHRLCRPRSQPQLQAKHPRRHQLHRASPMNPLPMRSCSSRLCPRPHRAGRP